MYISEHKAAIHSYAPANEWTSSMLLPATMHTLCSRNVNNLRVIYALVMGKNARKQSRIGA